MTRKYLSSIVLIILAGLAVVACLVIAAPFLPALTWALTLAVLAYPLHAWLQKRIPRPELAAACSVAIVAVCLLAPVLMVGHVVVQQASERFGDLRKAVQPEALKQTLQQNPRLSGALTWLQGNIDLEQEFTSLARSLQARIGPWLQASLWAAAQLLVALFITLFFLFRDREACLRALRRIIPLSDREAGETLESVRGMIHAIVYGNATVAMVQGGLGGLMFWVLGVPGALLWAVVMAILSLVPSMGAFIVWLPVAVAMAAQGEWIKAGVLAVWGVLAVGTIDNILYPFLVGQEMRMHPVPVFIATVGGLVVFGAVGLVLGPVAFAVTLALLEVLRRRTAADRPVETPT
jgi:predicted PurR-regulated permease PerM